MESQTEFFRWKPIESGLIPKDKLEGWIGGYFNRKEDLSQFRRRSTMCLELLYDSDGEIKGYAFVIPNGEVNKDHEARMLFIKRVYEEDGKTIDSYFVDKNEGLSGFSWSLSHRGKC
ncbi:hypothetical protein HYT57_04450 [Candidatus Woesearchaeota archaeon]|nr:hypothetical protein [Candidatus Woesearchaeota archaeon]